MRRGYGHPVVEVDVGDDGEGRFRADGCEGRHGLLARQRHADDLAAGLGKARYLGEGAPDVGRLGGAHGLYADRGAPTDGDVANHDPMGPRAHAYVFCHVRLLIPGRSSGCRS